MTNRETCDASAVINGFNLDGSPATFGPCILRHRHDGPMHKDINGATWRGSPLPQQSATTQADLDDPVEPDYPAAWALARHIADHPISVVQAAFRYLNAPVKFEFHDDGLPESDDAHRCGNCEGVDPDSCLVNPDRRAAEDATQAADAQLRARYVEAIRAAAGDCDGDCGLPEAVCVARHPVQVASYGHGRVVAVHGPVETLVDAVATVRDGELAEARSERDRLRRVVGAVREFGELYATSCDVVRAETARDLLRHLDRTLDEEADR